MTSQGTTLVEELEAAAKELDCFCWQDNPIDPEPCERHVQAVALRARAARVRELKVEHACSDEGNCNHSSCFVLRALTGPLPGPSGGAGDSKQKETP